MIPQSPPPPPPPNKIFICHSKHQSTPNKGHFTGFSPVKLIRAVLEYHIKACGHCFNHIKKNEAPSEWCCTSLTPFGENPALDKRQKAGSHIWLATVFFIVLSMALQYITFDHYAVPSANKRDLRSIEQTLNDMRSRKKPKLDSELSSNKADTSLAGPE